MTQSFGNRTWLSRYATHGSCNNLVLLELRATRFFTQTACFNAKHTRGLDARFMALASEASDRFRPKVLIPKLGHTASLELENLGSSWFVAGALVDDSNRGGAELLVGTFC